MEWIETVLELDRGREAEERAVRTAARPSHTEMNTRSKRRLEALSRRYPGKLELRVPQGATPVTLRMQALTAARFDDILAHAIFTGTGSRDSRLYPLWDRAGVCAPPQTNRPLLAVREDGGVYSPSLRSRAVCAFRPPRVCF